MSGQATNYDDVKQYRLDPEREQQLLQIDLPPFCDPLFMPVLQFSGIRLKIC